MSFDKRLLFNKDCLFEVHIQLTILHSLHMSRKLCYVEKWKLKVVYYGFFQFIFLISLICWCHKNWTIHLLTEVLIFFVFNSMNIHVPQFFFIRFHTHAKIQATQADRIIPFTFNGLEMNGVKYALFYSLIASLGWGNWVLFPPWLNE